MSILSGVVVKVYDSWKGFPMSFTNVDGMEANREYLVQSIYTEGFCCLLDMCVTCDVANGVRR